MAAIDGKRFDRTASGSADGLTRVMILHPIACGLAFIAFLLALGAGVFGSLLSAMVAGVAWIITLIVMAIDFSLFGVCSIPDVGEVKLNCSPPDHQKPRQQRRQRLARLLLDRHVDHPRSHDLALPWHAHRALHLLQCEEEDTCRQDACRYRVRQWLRRYSYAYDSA